MAACGRNFCNARLSTSSFRRIRRFLFDLNESGVRCAASLGNTSRKIGRSGEGESENTGFNSASGGAHLARGQNTQRGIGNFTLKWNRLELPFIQRRSYCSSTSPEAESSSQRTGGTYDAEEVEKFSSLSEDWWDEFGEFQALHSLNALRIPLVRDGLCSNSEISSKAPLDGFSIADIGCGGGILSEPLARLGAEVVGIDASLRNVEAAERHAKLDPDLAERLTYRSCLVEELAEEAGPRFDAVVASEIIEHVADPKTFVKACCDLTVPGGSLFFTTMNRTMLAYGLAVFAAERVFKIVPAGSHDWNKFVSPDELTDILEKNGATPRLVHGMILNPLTLRWSWCSDTSMNYALHAIKKSENS